MMGLNQSKATCNEADDYEEDLSVLFTGLQFSDSISSRQRQYNLTGLAYDIRMEKHCNLWCPSYPENAKRISEPFLRCKELGLVTRCRMIKVEPAQENVLSLVHYENYIRDMSRTQELNEDELKEESSKYHCVFLNEHSWQAALLAVNSVLQLTENVVGGDFRNGMAIVRPPGHHAMCDEACGYSIFNNVAIAAQYAIDKLGVKRVLIVDWDVHHGQATQYTFYDDPRVLYFSIHRYDQGEFWPHLRESDYDFIGEGKGKGFNINIPLNTTGMTNGDYLAVFNNVLLPVAYEFNPDLILVSGGYDSALGDLKGLMHVHPACYAHFVHKLMGIADGNVVIALEGGYCLESLSEGVAHTLSALLGDPTPQLASVDDPSDSIVETILNAITALRPHWNSLCVQGISEYMLAPNLDHLKTSSWAETREVGLPDWYREPKEDERPQLRQQLEHLRKSTVFPIYPNRTCLIYDTAMMKHRDEKDRWHPEKPQRVQFIVDKLLEYGLLQRCKLLQSRVATKEDILLVHDPVYFEKIKMIKAFSQNDRNTVAKTFNSVYLNRHTFSSAVLSAGCVLQVVDQVCSNTSRNGAAIVRPPGHHAEMAACMGFCIFNNVAIAARYAQTKYQLERVLIVDWDVHHGNGTQNIFEDDPSVLFISLHRHDNGQFFPGSRAASPASVGVGKGEGFTVNIAWNKRPIGDAEYISAFHHLVLPIAYEFSPQLVLVSAGFDAARGDPLGGLRLSPDLFAHLTHQLSCLAQGHVILVLEGGYNLEAIGECMSHCVSSLLGDPCPRLGTADLQTGGIAAIRSTLDIHSKYWKSLKFGVDIPMLGDSLPLEGALVEAVTGNDTTRSDSSSTPQTTTTSSSLST